jgi:hypothetical protein
MSLDFETKNHYELWNNNLDLDVKYYWINPYCEECKTNLEELSKRVFKIGAKPVRICLYTVDNLTHIAIDEKD